MSNIKNNELMIGSVKFFDRKNDFGFISTDDYGDFHFTRKDLVDENTVIHQNDMVSFFVVNVNNEDNEKRKKFPSATNIIKIFRWKRLERMWKRKSIIEAINLIFCSFCSVFSFILLSLSSSYLSKIVSVILLIPIFLATVKKCFFAYNLFVSEKPIIYALTGKDLTKGINTNPKAETPNSVENNTISDNDTNNTNQEEL